MAIKPCFGREVTGVSVVISIADRDASRDRIVSNVQSGLAPKEIITAISEQTLNAGPRLRGAGDNVDRAARGITSVQCALRSLKHFDPLNVEQVS